MEDDTRVWDLPGRTRGKRCYAPVPGHCASRWHSPWSCRTSPPTDTGAGVGIVVTDTTRPPTHAITPRLQLTHSATCPSTPAFSLESLEGSGLVMLDARPHTVAQTSWIGS
ncbi:hypothetical protein B0H19DRAFT_601973 [Mycena capillaripes]|nr:hypothetical protein B0H19DRAFT_601973 [Mycena capillaripes]